MPLLAYCLAGLKEIRILSRNKWRAKGERAALAHRGGQWNQLERGVTVVRRGDAALCGEKLLVFRFGWSLPLSTKT